MPDPTPTGGPPPTLTPNSNDQLPGAGPAPGAQPFVMPEKFKGKSAEQVAQSYVELERQRPATTATPAAAPAPQAAPPAPQAPAPGAPPTTPGGIPEPHANPMARFQPYAEEYARTGTLSQQSVTQLAADGIPKELAVSHLQGLAAIAQLTVQTGHSRVGGKENYDAMLAWASGNLNATERANFNAAMTASPEAFGLLVDGVAARWKASVGTTPSSQVLGDQLGGGGGAAPYASEEEYQRDVQKPEYRSDPAFRQKVYARLNNSRWLADKAARTPGWQVNATPMG